MKLEFVKLSDYAHTPTRAHATDAGLDLYASRILGFDDETGIITYGTDIAVQIPEGYVGLLFPRSSIAERSVRLANCVGVIDPGYQGELRFKFDSPLQFQNRIHVYTVGERIGQLIIIKNEIPDELVEVKHFNSSSDRKTGGFGSTGV